MLLVLEWMRRSNQRPRTAKPGVNNLGSWSP